MSGLHPYLIDSWNACQDSASRIVHNIDNSMLDDRPDSQYMVVTATNIRMYCFLVDLPVGHKITSVVYKIPYILDVTPQADDNLCLFRCIVRSFRPEDSENDREIRVILMWRIFKASQFLNVKSDSVILDHSR